MELTDIGGLPAHPHIVHLPVVLVPLATVGALLMLLRPSWRHTFAIPTAVLATVAAIATQLAIGSGEALEEQVRESQLVETHSQIAEQARPFIFLFALVMIAVVVWDQVQRRQDRASSSLPGSEGGDAADPGGDTIVRTGVAVRSRATTVAVVLTAVGLLLGIASTVEVYRAGHSGAKATWHDVKPTSGDGDGDGDTDGD